MARCRLFFIACSVFVMFGCGHNMALTKGQSDINITKNSIALLSVKISNQVKPKYQLDIVGALICPVSERCGHGTVKYYHKTNSSYRINFEENRFTEYLLSYELESGAYNFHSIAGVYDHFPITGGGPVPLNFEIMIEPNSIIYLGHLDIVMRAKKNDSEISAGSVVPLIDQALVGASSGTYDVIVEDKYDEDIKLFRAEYPALQKAKIEKAILPKWIRPENIKKQ